MKFLGIDVGTSGTRAVLIDSTGRLLGAGTGEHAAISSPQHGWAEQDPEDWWRAAREAIPACLNKAGASGADVSAVGITGQMHGLVLLDPDGKVLRPAIIWCDQRTEAECRAITTRVGASRLIELAANPALTAFTLPRIWWVRENEPAIWPRVRTMLLPKDYVRFRLTGVRATDVNDASGTLLFDVARRRWSRSMLEACELSEDLLPVALESHEISGRLSETAARENCLRCGTPVVAGAGDQGAGALAMGIVEPGAVSTTIGTSGVVFAATASPLVDPRGRIHTFCHAAPNRWHVMGVTQAAGFSLRWFRDQFGTGSGAKGDEAYAALLGEAAQAPAGAAGLLWAPYLMGERTPHLDPQARGALVGISASHTRAHVIRAILEGVAFSLRDTLTIFAELRLPIHCIRLGGGGARGALWRQIQADAFGRPVERVEAEEGAAFGAALLAGVGVGAWPSIEEACKATVHVVETINLDRESARVMDRQYKIYRRIYPALRDLRMVGQNTRP